MITVSYRAVQFGPICATEEYMDTKLLNEIFSETVKQKQLQKFKENHEDSITN